MLKSASGGKSAVKIPAVIFYILTVVLIPRFNLTLFLLFFIPQALVILIGHIRPAAVLKRTSALLPFTLLAAVFIPFLKEGSARILFQNIIFKSFLSILAMSILAATTEFPEILKGLKSLGMPRIMVLLLSFTHRYILVILEEVKRMQRSLKLRQATGIKRQIRAAGGMVGILFIRTLERAERVYSAMRARGFETNDSRD